MSSATAEERELNLVLKLELRLGSAESDDKLQNLLKTYLTPLLLKLASEHASVRNKTIGVCQYVNRRVKSSPSIALPVASLMKQFGEQNSSLVRSFDIVYIQQGLQRLSTEEGVAIIPDVLRSTIPSGNTRHDSPEGKVWSVAFQFLLQLLRTWKLPDRTNQANFALKEQMALSEAQTDLLAFWLSKVLLYERRKPVQQTDASLADGRRDAGNYSGLSPEEEIFITGASESIHAHPSTPITLAAKANVANFLFTSIFTDQQRFLSAVILSSDSTNVEAFRIGDTMFKQCEFDLESMPMIDALFSLYDGTKSKIQIRILGLLSRSKLATKRPLTILDMIDQQFGSPTEGLEATKLRTALFNFLDWTVKVGDEADLRAIGGRIQKAMRDSIETQGWPSANHALGEGVSLSPAQIDMRQKAYTCIGSLASKSSPSFELVKFLFTSLRCDPSNNDVHASISEALGRVINAYAITDKDGLNALKTLLLSNMTAEVGQEDPTNGYVNVWDTRFTTVKVTNRCLPFSDVDARYIDLLAVGAQAPTEQRNLVQELAEEGARGLDPYLHSTSFVNFEHFGTKTGLAVPSFELLMQRISRNTVSQTADVLLTDASPMNKIESAAVTFCSYMFVMEALQKAGKIPEIQPEWKRHIDALIANEEDIRRLIRIHLRSNALSVVPLLELAFHGLASGVEDCATTAVELCSLAPNSVIRQLVKTGFVQCEKGVRSTNMNIQGSAARLLGILASLQEPSSLEAQLTLLSNRVEGWKTAIGLQVVQLRGHLLSLGFILTRLSLRGASEAIRSQLIPLSRTVAQIICESKDDVLKDAASSMIAELALCSPQTIAFSWDTESVLDSLIRDAKREREGAVAAIGRLLRYMSRSRSNDFVSSAMEKVYALHEIRKVELQFAVGETLAVAATGWNSQSTITNFDVDADRAPDEVDDGLLSKILPRLIDDCQKTKPSLRKASAIWLLCVIQFCGKQDAVKSQLRDCQVAFSKLLTDRDEVVQETGSRGLSLVYEMGDKAIREDLVRDLVQSFTGTNAKMSGTVNEDTQLFEAGALPTEGGSSVTTYKDVVSLASEMGDPSLVYRFMNLASNNAIWTSRAAFGRFGLSNILADSSYLGENKKFYPKLFRYRFDPNPNVQRSMNDIWKALVKNPGAVIDQNFDLIIRDLLKCILGREWRVREASCAAIAELVQDRDVEKYEKYLQDIWQAAFKVVDDIKESVRVAALKLCRTLTNLLIRNLEVGDGMTKRAGIMLEHALTFLLQQFTTGGSKEVQTYAISSLLEVIKKCPPKALRPYAPVLLQNLITSLSSLEHESINYLHLNADKYGLTPEKLDKMRVSGVNSSPVTESIDRCLESLDTTDGEEDSQAADLIKDAMRRLEMAFKESIGLPSKVGLSRVLITLVIRHNLMFRPYVDRFVQLNRKSMVDRNVTISVSFAMSLAYMLRLASEKQVHETCEFAKGLYFKSEQTSNRALAGEILQATAKVSNDLFMRFATSFLPFAFIGRNDTDPEVKDRFECTWKDNVGGSRSISLYFSEIVGLIQLNVKSPSWAIKHACCLSVADLIESVEVQDQYTDAQAERLWPALQEALSGKTWEGKEKVILAYPKFVKKARHLWSDAQTGRLMRQIATREAKRTNFSYRPHAIEALGEFALARQDLDISSEISPYLKDVVEEMTADGADHMDVDSGDGAGRHASKHVGERTIVAAVTCLFQILSGKSSVDALEPSLWIVERARKSGLRNVRMALYEGAKSFTERNSIAADGEDGGEREGGGKGQEKVVEVFTRQMSLALLADNDQADENGPAYIDDHENVRSARVKLALALVQHWDVSVEGVENDENISSVSSVPVARALPPPTPHGKLVLTHTLQTWLGKERSRAIRDDLQQAIQFAKS